MPFKGHDFFMDISVNKSLWLIMGSVLGISLLAVVGIWHGTTPEDSPLSVLFIGNSYTAANSLPDLFADVAESAGFARPAVKAYTPGGKTLGGHLSDARTRSLIHDGPAVGQQWDVVVLQEQSEMPVAAQTNPAVNKSFLDGAAGLYELVKESNPVARVILFETWARHAAWWSSGHAEAARDGINPADMMQRLKTGYEQASQTMAGPGGAPVPIARVGELWAINYNSASPIMLHASDGSHPNWAGSYLAALDIFSTIYHASPQNVEYRGPLTRAEAAALRSLVSRNFPNIQAGISVLESSSAPQRKSGRTVSGSP